ncbi:hypothetical protein Q9189_002911 [Teloschistes chrysophthalmus]
MASKRLLLPILLSKPHSYRPIHHLLSPLLGLPIRRTPNRLPYPNTPFQTKTQNRLSSHLSQPPKTYTFKDIQALSAHPSPKTLLIDVREPSELSLTGKIPTAVNMPLTSCPDAIFLDPEVFRERFGFGKPGSGGAGEIGRGEGEEEEEEEGVAGHGGADLAAKEGVEMEGVRYAGSPTSQGKGSGEAEGEGEAGGKGEGEGVQEVIFYCKAGVRSRAAMQMAAGEGGWRGVRVGQWGGGWVEWEAGGGRVER